LINPLMANMKIAVKVGKTVCVHAGLTSKHLDQYGGIKGMNEEAQRYVKTIYHGENNNFGKYGSMEELVFNVNSRAQVIASKLPGILGGGADADDSPVWMRAYSAPNDAPPKNPKAQQMIDAALFHCQGERMVMGHTVQRKINGALNGRAWRIDVGASRGVMGGQPEILEVSMENGKEVVSILTKTEKIPASARLVGAPQLDPLDTPMSMANPYTTKQLKEKDNVEAGSFGEATASEETNNTTNADVMQPAMIATAVTAAGEIASQVMGSL
jgi:hypothetical protein